MNEFLTDQVLGGLIMGTASKGDQAMAWKGIETLQQQLESLKADAARLDYLIAQELQVWECNGRYCLRGVTEAYRDTDEYQTAREAIDTALKGDAVKG